MIKKSVLLGAVSLLLVGLGLTSGCATTTGATGVNPNVPDISLQDIDGQTVYLNEHIGKKVVVMSFWATWCMPCRQELTALQSIYEEYKNDGLEILAINIDGPESIAGARPAAKQHGWTFPILLDTETQVTMLYNSKRQTPMLRIFNREGKIVYTQTTFQPGEVPALKRKIRSIIDKME